MCLCAPVWLRARACVDARGADRLAGPRCLLQARMSKWGPRPPPSCTRLCNQNANTDKPGTKSRAWGAGRAAAWHLGSGTVPECTVWQAATTAGVPAKCSVQPTMPYAPMTCFHINSAISRNVQITCTNRQEYETMAGGYSSCLQGHSKPVRHVCVVSSGPGKECCPRHLWYLNTPCACTDAIPAMPYFLADTGFGHGLRVLPRTWKIGPVLWPA